MPNRILKESIKSSPQIDMLSWFEEVVFYRLMVSADDYGCMDGRTVLLKNELFPTKDTVTKKAVEDAVAHLVSVGLLCKYTVNGMPYLFFPTWEKHQRVRNKHRKFPEPQLDSNLLSNDGQMTASCQSESESNPNPIQSESKSVTRFAPPTREEAENLCREKGYTLNLDTWFAYYEQNGWRVGRDKMKSWQASLAYWQSKEKPGKKPMNQTAQGVETVDMDRLRRMTASFTGEAAT